MDARTKTILSVIALFINIVVVLGGGFYTYFSIQGKIKESLARLETQIGSINHMVSGNSNKIDVLSESDLLYSDDFEKRLNKQAPWVVDRSKVIYRIELLESSNKKISDKIESFEQRQSEVITKLDILLKRK